MKKQTMKFMSFIETARTLEGHRLQMAGVPFETIEGVFNLRFSNYCRDACIKIEKAKGAKEQAYAKVYAIGELDVTVAGVVITMQENGVDEEVLDELDKFFEEIGGDLEKLIDWE